MRVRCRAPCHLGSCDCGAGVNIVAGAGFYVASTHPSFVGEWGEAQIARHIVDEVAVGIDGTDVKAGLIGEVPHDGCLK